MDCVLILFGKKLDPVVSDPDKHFLLASWNEALKVLNIRIIIVNLSK
jgi:hypothetical protein